MILQFYSVAKATQVRILLSPVSWIKELSFLWLSLLGPEIQYLNIFLWRVVIRIASYSVFHLSCHPHFVMIKMGHKKYINWKKDQINKESGISFQFQVMKFAVKAQTFII